MIGASFFRQLNALLREVQAEVAHGEHLGAVASARALREGSEELERQTIAEAREAGVTWQSLGDCLGVSRQAVQERYASRR